MVLFVIVHEFEYRCISIWTIKFYSYYRRSTFYHKTTNVQVAPINLLSVMCHNSFNKNKQNGKNSIQIVFEIIINKTREVNLTSSKLLKRVIVNL